MSANIITFEKQTVFADAVLEAVTADEQRLRYFLYGGAIRGGKTVVCLAIIFALCRIYAGSRWTFVRKDLSVMRRNLWPAFDKFRPQHFVGSVNKTSYVASCANGSEIVFMPENIIKDPEGYRFRGFETNGFVNEEAHEITEQTFHREQERAGTWKIPDADQQPNPVILGTCNPAQGWVKQTWYNPWKAGTIEAPYYYLPARADDNPFVSDAQKQAWEDLPAKEYSRFVEGDWDVADDPDQLIKFEWVHRAREVPAQGGRSRLGVDVARYGDDATVLAYLVGNELTEIEEHQGLSIDRTASIVGARMEERAIGADMTGVDTVGLGAGVADILRNDGRPVVEIVSGAAAVDARRDGEELYEAFTFKNLRSQMWWHLREGLRHSRIRLTAGDQKLVDDLLAPRYKITGDKEIVIESKDDIRKRLGRSTDHGDALVYAYALTNLMLDPQPASGSSMHSMRGDGAPGTHTSNPLTSLR